MKQRPRTGGPSGWSPEDFGPAESEPEPDPDPDGSSPAGPEPNAPGLDGVAFRVEVVPGPDGLNPGWWRPEPEPGGALSGNSSADIWTAVRHEAGEAAPDEVAVELRPGKLRVGELRAGERHSGSAGRLGRSVPAAVAVATAAVFFAGGGWTSQAYGHSPAGPGKAPAVTSDGDSPTVAPPAGIAPVMMPALQPAEQPDHQPAQQSAKSSSDTSAPPAATRTPAIGPNRSTAAR